MSDSETPSATGEKNREIVTALLQQFQTSLQRLTPEVESAVIYLRYSASEGSVQASKETAE